MFAKRILKKNPKYIGYVSTVVVIGGRGVSHLELLSVCGFPKTITAQP